MNLATMDGCGDYKLYYKIIVYILYTAYTVKIVCGDYKIY